MFFFRKKLRMGYALAPKQLVEDKRKVRYMYREEPDNAQDSGWRFFSGDEDDEYVNDPDNIDLYDVNTIADIDPDIIPYLNRPVGSAFEREDGALPFVKSPMNSIRTSTEEPRQSLSTDGVRV